MVAKEITYPNIISRVSCLEDFDYSWPRRKSAQSSTTEFRDCGRLFRPPQEQFTFKSRLMSCLKTSGRKTSEDLIYAGLHIIPPTQRHTMMIFVITCQDICS